MILQSFVTFKDKPRSESIRINKVLIADEEVTKSFNVTFVKVCLQYRKLWINWIERKVVDKSTRSVVKLKMKLLKMVYI